MPSCFFLGFLCISEDDPILPSFLCYKRSFRQVIHFLSVIINIQIKSNTINQKNMVNVIIYSEYILTTPI
jgi:hypothetical protein